VTARPSGKDREWLARSCERSGVPEKISDPVALARAADLLRPASATSPHDTEVRW
jgi:hypothetical protein